MYRASSINCLRHWKYFLRRSAIEYVSLHYQRFRQYHCPKGRQLIMIVPSPYAAVVTSHDCLKYHLFVLLRTSKMFFFSHLINIPSTAAIKTPMFSAHPFHSAPASINRYYSIKLSVFNNS